MLLSSVLAQLQQAFITILLQCYINLESTAHLQLKLLGVLGLAVPANKTPHHEKCSKDGHIILGSLWSQHLQAGTCCT